MAGGAISFIEHERGVTGTGLAACSSQESCAGLLAGLMTLIHVIYREPCDSVMQSLEIDSFGAHL